MIKINRRQALARLAGLAGGATLLPRAFASDVSTTASASVPVTGSSESVTLAHITDVHLLPKSDAEKWFAQCLHHLQSNSAKPKMIINTGDCVMDTLSQTRQEADALWTLWRNVLQRENSLPIHHCLGNHDHFALALSDDNPVKKDPAVGKKLAFENLGLNRGYESFDVGAWHVILLDSCLPAADQPSVGWIAALDEVQMAWLKNDLNTTPKERPVIVFSHVPIIQICSFLNIQPDEKQSYNFATRKMHADADQLLDLFKKHPNVKVCVSGHIHLKDRIELEGVTYICDGAVSGNWWNGPRENFPPAYSTFTLNPDGSFVHNFQPYGWQAPAKA